MRRLPPTVLALAALSVLVWPVLLVSPVVVASATPSSDGSSHAPSLADREHRPQSTPGDTADAGDHGSDHGRSGSGSEDGSGSGSGSGSDDDRGPPPPPPPPPALPETPVTALLPLSALTVGGVVIAVRRRRRTEGGA